MNILILCYKFDDRKRMVSSTLRSYFSKLGHSADIYDVLLLNHSLIEKLQDFDGNSDAIMNLFVPGVAKLFFGNKIDVVIAIDVMSGLIASKIRSKIEFSLYQLDSDYSYHKDYLDIGADAYFLSYSAYLSCYFDKGIANDKLFVTGIPLLIENNLTSLFVPDTTKICLLACDGFDNDTICRIADKASDLCNVIIYISPRRNETLKFVREIYLHNENVSVFDELSFDLKRLSAIISNPYSPLVSLAINNNIPLMVYNKKGSFKSYDYLGLCDEGLCIGTETIGQIYDTLWTFLCNKEIPNFIRDKQKSLSQIDSCKEIFNIIFDSN